MLDIEPEQRKLLSARGELTQDDEGDEVLVGLTLAETHFYLAFEEFSAEMQSPRELFLYLALRRRHVAAQALVRLA